MGKSKLEAGLFIEEASLWESAEWPVSDWLEEAEARKSIPERSLCRREGLTIGVTRHEKNKKISYSRLGNIVHLILRAFMIFFKT